MTHYWDFPFFENGINSKFHLTIFCSVARSFFFVELFFLSHRDNWMRDFGSEYSFKPYAK